MVTKNSTKSATKKQTVAKSSMPKTPTKKAPLKSRAATKKPLRTTRTSKKAPAKQQLQPIHKKLIGAFVVLVIIAVGGASLVRSPSIDAASVAGPITGVASKCLDNQHSRTVNGNKIQLYRCNGTAAQAWSAMDDGTIRAQGMCLDVSGSSKKKGTLVQLYECNGTVAQKWVINNDKTIVNPNSGLCLDDKYAGTADGNTIWMYPCNKTVAQAWTMLKVVSTQPTPAPTPAPRTPVTPPNPPAITPPVSDGKFTLVIFPDTQHQTFASTKDLFLSRTKKVASEKDARDIRFVGHTGDLVSSGGNKLVDRQHQYDAASAAYATIDQSGIPYLMSIGNHDTKAFCSGGSACDPTKSREYIRDTTVFNSYFSTSRLKLPNAQLFEAGKVDNAYKTFSAEGTNWLILTLEMTPRTAAVNWAKNVVAAHPKHNVVILNHYLLTRHSTITTSNAGYGDRSGRYVYDNLILKYPNVKMAFSGHIGIAGHRTDVGANGNKVVSFLGTFHDYNFNPTRYVTIDTKNNTVTSDVQAATIGAAYLKKYPTTKLPDYNNYDAVFTGMNFVK